MQHLCATLLTKNYFWKTKKFLFCVTGTGDWILPNSLSETFLMMCRSTSAISLWVSMQFFRNYRITKTAHIAWIFVGGNCLITRIITWRSVSRRELFNDKDNYMTVYHQMTNLMNNPDCPLIFYSIFVILILYLHVSKKCQDTYTPTAF